MKLLKYLMCFIDLLLENMVIDISDRTAVSSEIAWTLCWPVSTSPLRHVELRLAQQSSMQVSGARQNLSGRLHSVEDHLSSFLQTRAMSVGRSMPLGTRSRWRCCLVKTPNHGAVKPTIDLFSVDFDPSWWSSSTHIRADTAWGDNLQHWAHHDLQRCTWDHDRMSNQFVIHNRGKCVWAPIKCASGWWFWPVRFWHENSLVGQVGYGRLKDACNVIMEFDFSDMPVCVSFFGRKKC